MPPTWCCESTRRSAPSTRTRSWPVVLEEIGRDDVVARYHADLWRQAGTIEVRREPPLTTAVGKVLPFHLLRSAEARHQ